MSLDDLIDEPGLGLANILDRLARDWVRQKTDEIARMPGLERNADFAVVLHAADTGAVAGPRIKDDERPFVRVDGGALGRDDARQHVIHRTRELSAIEHQFDIEAQDMRCFAGIVLDIVVAALPQHIQ